MSAALKGLFAVGAVALLAPISWDAWQSVQRRSAERARAAALADIAAQALEDGDTTQALVALQRARDLHPEDAALRRTLAITQARLVAGEPEALDRESALKLRVELALSTTDADEPAVRALALGHIAQVAGRSAEARKQFERAAELAPEDPRARFAMARVLLDRGLMDEAIPHFGRAADLAPEDARYRRAYGMALLKQKKFERAAAELARAADIQSDSVTWERLGEARLGLDQNKEAAEALQKAITGARDRARRGRIQARLGFAMFKAGLHAKAIAALRASLRDAPSAATLYNLGVAYHVSGDHRSAADALQRALAEDPTNVEGQLRLVVSLVKLGQRERAQALADQLKGLAESDPGFTQAAEQAARFVAAP